MSSTPYIVPGHEHVVIQDPNNITSEECYALALCGAEAWNAWRECHPVNNNVLNKSNTVLLRSVHFNAGTDFKNFKFGAGSVFEDVTWLGSVSFEGCEFEGGTTFNRCKFYECNNLKEELNGHSNCGKQIKFEGQNFGGLAQFIDCVFDNVSFNGSFSEDLRFNNCVFRQKSSFTSMRIEGDLKFSQCYFLDTTFLSKTIVKELAIDFSQFKRVSAEKLCCHEALYIEGSIFYLNLDLMDSLINRFSNLKTIFIKGVDIRKGYIGGRLDIEQCVVVDGFLFNKCMIQEKFYVKNSNLDKIKLIDAVINADCYFENCKINEFDYSLVGQSAHVDCYGMKFTNVKFTGPVIFDGRTLGALDFSKEKSLGTVPSRSLSVIYNEIVCLHRMKMLCCKYFLSVFTWENKNTVIFKEPPNFFNTKLHQDTSFDKAIFPKAKGMESSARAYSVLKKAFLEMQDMRQANLFAKKEFQEEKLLKPHNCWLQNFLRKRLYCAYAILSGYGFSFWLPLVWLIVLNVGSVLSYMYFAGYELCWSNCNRTVDLFQYNFQAIPFMGSVDVNHPVAEAIKSNDMAGWALTILFFHKLLTIIFLFLIGLALRNMFRMK